LSSIFSWTPFPVNIFIYDLKLILPFSCLSSKYYFCILYFDLYVTIQVSCVPLISKLDWLYRLHLHNTFQTIVFTVFRKNMIITLCESTGSTKIHVDKRRSKRNLKKLVDCLRPDVTLYLSDKDDSKVTNKNTVFFVR
jgi:hypothetical protein